MIQNISTGRYTIDAHGRKVYVGAKVYYRDKKWLLEDIQYVSWNANQYLTLQDVFNKNKRVTFISPQSVISVKK